MKKSILSLLTFSLLSLSLNIGHAAEVGPLSDDATKAQAEKGTSSLLSAILTKLGSIQDLSFDLNIDTSLPGLPLDNSKVSLEVPLTDDIESHIGSATDKPNFFLGEKGLVIVASAEIKRSEAQVALQAQMSFKNAVGKASYLPISVAMAGYPNLKLRVSGISVSSLLNDPSSAEGRAMPLGEKIQGACNADLMKIKARNGNEGEKEVWAPLQKCTFVATYNKDKKSYDVKMNLKN